MSEKEIQLDGGPQDGLRLTVSSHLQSVEVAYVESSKAVRANPEDPKPWTEINTVTYRNTYDWDEGREIYRPDWKTVKTYSGSP